MRRLTRSLPWIASLLVTLGLLEAVVTAFLAFPGLNAALPAALRGHVARLYATRDRMAISLMPDCAQYDPETFYVLRPGATCRFANREYDTAYRVNSAGLRDVEADLTAPEVIVLGDSFAMGWGVEQAETFAERLQAMTGQRVLNAGIASFGTERAARMLARLDRSGLRTVVVQHCDNDVVENARAVAPGGLNIRDAADYRRISRKHLRAVTGYVPFKHLYYLVKEAAKAALSGGAPVPVAEEAARFVTLLGRIRALAPQAKIVITELNGRGKARSTFLAEVRRLLGDDPGLEVIDIETTLPDSDYFQLDDHLTAAGHRHVAEALAPYLKP